MRAAARFWAELGERRGQVARVRAELFGSLGATGRGHASDTAVILGLLGLEPDTVDPRAVTEMVDRVRREHRLALAGEREIDFDPDTGLVLDGRRSLPFHPNGMTFTAYDNHGDDLAQAGGARRPPRRYCCEVIEC